MGTDVDALTCGQIYWEDMKDVPKTDAWFRTQNGGRRVAPLLGKDGRMRLRTAVAYGPKGAKQFLLSVYVRCIPAGAFTRGGTMVEVRYELGYRELVPQSTSCEEQVQLLDFYCNVIATRLGLDYTLLHPHKPKKTPLGYHKENPSPSLSPRELARIIDFAEKLTKEK